MEKLRLRKVRYLARVQGVDNWNRGIQTPRAMLFTPLLKPLLMVWTVSGAPWRVLGG